jgi:hypothetical protein
MPIQCTTWEEFFDRHFNNLKNEYRREGAIAAYTWVLEHVDTMDRAEFKQQISSALEALSHGSGSQTD